MTKDDLIRRVRRVKLKLAAGGAVRRRLVPLTEICEFWLSHGFREVLVRSRLRLSGRATLPPPRAYAPPLDPARLTPLTIPPPGARLTTSIVIPVLNNAAMTHQCLAAIIEQTAAGTYEVIVADNGSDAMTQRMLDAVRGLHVIRNTSNVGFVAACNQGLEAARGEYVLFLNNDTVVQPGWLEAMLRTFEQQPSPGAVGARLIYPNGRLQEAGGIIWSDGDGWNYGHQEDPEAPEYNYVRDVDYCSGACLLAPRALLAQLHGFDPRYSPAYYEDTDLAFRLRELGYRVLYQPAARVVHFGGATAGTDTGRGFKRFQVENRHKFKERHAAALAAQCPHNPDLLRRARDRRSGKRILLVDHMVPHHDEDSGSVRMMALLRLLVDLGHRVTFLPDNFARIEPYTSELQQIGIEVLYGPYADESFVAKHRGEFDIAILCRAHVAARYLRMFEGAATRPFFIFDTVDVHHLREQRLAELEDDPGLAKAAAWTRDIEIGVMRDSDMTWVTSTHEAQLLGVDSSIPRIEIVPNIHGVRTGVPPFAARADLLFIGGFRHPPNEDAVIFFVDEILPRVRAELPDVRFLVVGSHTPPSIQRLASGHVIIRGFVKDVVPIFDGCRVSVAPLRYGAGVKGKVTQSLAWGVPVVATPIAAEGMGLVDGEHLMIESEPEAFARRVVRVYRDEALWTRLSQAGRTHIEAHLGYDSVRASVGAMLEGLPGGGES